TLNDGAKELIAPPPVWIYIVNLRFGFMGGGGAAS
ncbi:hypothetical protein A2U01_0102331, partial [Trifolium medium]|nr:hypothetical protein [Trifolium medium]